MSRACSPASVSYTHLDSVDDTAQIAAQNVIPCRRGVPVIHACTGRAAPGKALRKNLIVYAALRPCRHGENIRLIDLQQLEAARLLHVREKPSVIEPSPVSRLILQPEAVFDVVRLPGKDGFARPLLPLTVLQACLLYTSESDHLGGVAS